MSVFEKCSGYLDARTGTYEYRTKRYDAVIDVIEGILGLPPDLTVADLGAGWTEFGHRLTERGFRGRYLPYDGAIDGRDLQYWEPPLADIDVCVAIEFLEHLRKPERLVETMFERARLTVVTTPDSTCVDTLGMDPDHIVALDKNQLYGMGFENVVSLTLFPGSLRLPGKDPSCPDTLLAWR